MEEIGLQFEARQKEVIDAVRRYVSEDGRRLVEECPLRPGLKLLRARPAEKEAPRSAESKDSPRSTWKAAHLAELFESYFDFFIQSQQRRGLVVCPTVDRWTATLYDEKTIDFRLLRAVSAALECRAVGYCFIEDDEYSYVEMLSGRVVEISSSFLADGGGLNFWSTSNGDPPPEGAWVRDGFLKQRYRFIPGFYDRPFLRGEKSEFSCYCYSAFPDQYEEKDNFPLAAFRYFYFHCRSR